MQTKNKIYVYNTFAVDNNKQSPSNGNSTIQTGTGNFTMTSIFTEWLFPLNYGKKTSSIWSAMFPLFLLEVGFLSTLLCDRFSCNEANVDHCVHWLWDTCDVIMAS